MLWVLITGLFFQLSFPLIQVFHRLTHHSHPTEHSTCLEQDPCHRSIYHKDQKRGCKHNHHIGNESIDCSICQLFQHADLQLNQTLVAFKALDFSEYQYDNHSFIISNATGIWFHERAPPCFL